MYRRLSKARWSLGSRIWRFVHFNRNAGRMRLKLIDWEGAVMAKTHYLLDRCIIPIALAGILLLGGQNALACGNGKLLFQDKFQTVDPRWGLVAVDPTRSVG